MCPVDHLGLEQLEVRYIGILAFEFAHVLNLLKFVQDERRIAVAFGMDEGQHTMALLPAVVASQPSANNEHLDTDVEELPYLGLSGRRKSAKKRKIAGII